MSEIRCWNVYKVKRTTTQEKMFITLCSKRVYEFGQWLIKWYGFYINSENQRMDANLACDVGIDQKTHVFLEKDSRTNVALLVEHYEGELEQRVGYIENGTCERIAKALEACGQLERSIEVMIMAAIREANTQTAIQPYP